MTALEKKQLNDKFTEWRYKAIDRMPEAATRVFALRNRGYMGCGFHWALEKQLGACIRYLNDFDDGTLYHGDRAVANQIAVEVLVENLFKNIVKAEQSAAECNDGE